MNVQELGVIGPELTFTVADPVASKTADCPAVTGAVFIVGSGLYTAHRERIRRSQLLALDGELSPNP